MTKATELLIVRWRMARSPSRPTSRRAARHFAQQPELEPHRASGGLTHSRLSLSFRCADPTRATMSSDAIDYVKKPAMEFIRDSWRLVKRCTKPDRTGASPRERRTMREACSSRTAAHQLRPQLELAAAHQTGRRGARDWTCTWDALAASAAATPEAWSETFSLRRAPRSGRSRHHLSFPRLPG